MKKSKIITRRIRRDLADFFENQNLTDEERNFILGCTRAQIKFPQLTARQWQIVLEIEQKYRSDNDRT